MNAALTAWLMTPETPDETLTLEDFLHRPEWHQRAAGRGQGADAFVIPLGGGEYNRELCQTCACVPNVSRSPWPTLRLLSYPTS